jgi:hypothetical protein
MAEPGEFLQPVTPNLARVLAQAANSAFIKTDTFYVVCRLLKEIPPDLGSDPYNVQTPAPTYADAQCQVTWLKQNDPNFEYGIFGPFSNTFSGFDRPPPTTQLQVASVDVTAGTGTASDPIPTIGGTEYDALFWSVEVVQKMLIPYYAQEYGPDYAQNVLMEFYAAPVALVAHLPWSEYGAIGTGGELLTGGSNPQAPATCDGNTNVVTRKQAKRIAVVLQHDADGNLQPKPLHPPQPAKA